MELGRFAANADGGRRPRRALWEPRGIAKPAALKERCYRAPVILVRAEFLVREGRAEPATSVRGATHIQVVSRATRDQADPLAPAGRRFGNFVFAANDGARAFRGER